MKTNLGTGYIIEGFDAYDSISYCELLDAMSLSGPKVYLYKGKTNEIPEEIAEKCVIQNGIEKGTIMDDSSIVTNDMLFGFKNYCKGFGVHEFPTAKESIISACNQEFCAIYEIF